MSVFVLTYEVLILGWTSYTGPLYWSHQNCWTAHWLTYGKHRAMGIVYTNNV